MAISSLSYTQSPQGKGGKEKEMGVQLPNPNRRRKIREKRGWLVAGTPEKEEEEGGVISRNADCAIPSEKSKAEEEEEKEPLLVLQLCKVLVTTTLVFLVLQLGEMEGCKGRKLSFEFSVLSSPSYMTQLLDR